MNSKSASAQRGGSTSFSNMEFDFGISSNRSRSLNDLKNQNNSSTCFSNSSSFPLQSMNPRPAPTPVRNSSKPSWTHQTSSSKSNHSGMSNAPISMAGDIFGKSWAAASSSTSSASGGSIGIINKNPNLFGDLVSSALGHGKGSSNVPIKNAVSVPNSASTGSSYSMETMADSLSKVGISVQTNSTSESPIEYGDFSNLSSNSSKSKTNSTFGGSFIPDFSGKQHDPFGSLMNFGPKPSSLNEGSKVNKNNHSDDIFGDFHNCSNVKSDSGLTSHGENIHRTDFMNENTASRTKSEDFVISSSDFDSFSKHPKASGEDLGMMFESTLSSSGAPTGIPGLDEWESDSKHEETTTEINGLSPPPVGISASSAVDKGMNHHKQGQYADAIKWLSWALALSKQSSGKEVINEILSCRASCYKEVGEYKKAIADCTEVLEKEEENVEMLVKRGLLYESVEKYKLGAEDLRKVMKLDPTNRVARSTIHRLTQLS